MRSKLIVIWFLITVATIGTARTGAGADAAPRQGEIIAVAESNYSSTLEHDMLVNAIGALGYSTVDVRSVVDAFQAGAHVLVVYAAGWDGPGLAASDLDTWFGASRGLIQIGEWHEFFPSDFEGRLPTPTNVTVTITDPGHPMTQGLSSSWPGHGFFYYAWPDGAMGYTIACVGESDLATVSAPGFTTHNYGIAALDRGYARAAYIGISLGGPAAGVNEEYLLANTLEWLIESVNLDTMVFVDDFEIGDTSAWTATVP
jgi:hypothetical protein